MKILLVDDSGVMRRIQKNHLSQLGQTDIVEASNGKMAYDMLTSDPGIDTVFLDWNMPEVDGITALRQIRANPAMNGVKVFMCTSEAEQSRVMEAIEAGANNYLVKPFTLEMIKDKLGL
jgi:two-component system, chemotaxis family, chemotaxis protein CheY